MDSTFSQAGRHSLLGPRAAQSGVHGKIAARKPKAKIHRIRSITVGFVAYTAVLVRNVDLIDLILTLQTHLHSVMQVHFSLSSQESFGDGSTAGTFPYEEFYQSLVRYVEETMIAEERTELLSWWTV